LENESGGRVEPLF